MRPILQALLLADQIIEDRATGKKTIVGVFNSLLITKDEAADPVAQNVEDVKPAMTLRRGTRAGSPSAFVSLTEVRAEIELVIRFVDMHDGNVLMNGTMRIGANDPLKTIEVVVPLPMLATPHEGVYALELLYANELLGSVRVNVHDVPRAKEEHP